MLQVQQRGKMKKTKCLHEFRFAQCLKCGASEIAVALGARGGASKSDAKIKASQRNGRKHRKRHAS